jgi:hypothetical protein
VAPTDIIPNWGGKLGGLEYLLRMSRIAHLTAYGLTIVATLWVFSFVLRQPAPLKIWDYTWICLPLLIAAIPFRWRARADLAALGLLLFIFCPLSLSIGTLYFPALLSMTFSGFADYWSRSRSTDSPRPGWRSY